LPIQFFSCSIYHFHLGGIAKKRNLRTRSSISRKSFCHTATSDIGAGKNLDARTLFSGLIDDVRIYNKALSAEEIAALSQ